MKQHYKLTIKYLYLLLSLYIFENNSKPLNIFIMNSTLSTQKPPNQTTGEQQLIVQVKNLLEKGPDQLIGSLEYMINKVTTHPDKMKEADFLAAIRALEIISFLQICKLNLNSTTLNSLQQ